MKKENLEEALKISGQLEKLHDFLTHVDNKDPIHYKDFPSEVFRVFLEEDNHFRPEFIRLANKMYTLKTEELKELGVDE